MIDFLAGWINRRQLEAIEYLKDENRFLKERLGGRRLRKARWESTAATDFFTVEVLTLRGLVSHYVLAILDLASRTEDRRYYQHPHEAWMAQMARKLTDAEVPFLRHTRFLIMDRETKCSARFGAALTRERIEPIRLCRQVLRI